MSKVQEVGTGTLIATLDGECKVLSMITFSSDSQMLAGLCLQGLGRSLTLMIWDLRTGKEIRRILTEIEATTFAGTTFVAKPFAFSPDGQIFATGASGDAGIQLWDLTTGKQIGRFRGYEGVVTSLAFDPSGCRLASGLANGTALIWNVASATKPEDPKKDSDPASPLSAPEKSPLVRESAEFRFRNTRCNHQILRQQLVPTSVRCWRKPRRSSRKSMMPRQGFAAWNSARSAGETRGFWLGSRNARTSEEAHRRNAGR